MPPKTKHDAPDLALQEDSFHKLQKWVNNLFSNRLAAYDEMGVVHIAPDVAKRFTLGMVKHDVLLAFGELEMAWAEFMPWKYAAIYHGKPNLYLVADPIVTNGSQNPAFGLSFEMQSAHDATVLGSYGRLQLRRYFSSISQNNQQPIVARRPFTELPIHLLYDQDSVFAIDTKPKRPKNSKGVV